MSDTVDLRGQMTGRRIEAVRGHVDSEGHGWTILTLDNGQEVHILDCAPWVFVDPDVM